MEAYLPKCLGSLIVDDKELFQKLDVIVVNDGSKDRTSEIAHGFEAKYPGVFRVIDKPNGHYGSCINAALPIAIGAYIKVLDADDYVDTNNFLRLLKVLENFIVSAILVDRVISDYVRVDADGNVLSRVSYRFPTETTLTPNELLSYDNSFVGLHAITYRTENLQKNRYKQLEGIPYTDTQWVLEPVQYEINSQYFPMVVVKYLVGREGQSVDPEVFIKSFNHYDWVVRYLLGRWHKIKQNKDGGYYEYYRNIIKECCRYVCSIYSCGWRGRYPTESGKDFDLIIKETDVKLWEELEECTASRKLKFHFVQEWRLRNYSHTSIKFKIFHFYTSLANLIYKIKARIGL